MTLIDTILRTIPPPHRAGYPFIGGALVAALVLGAFSSTLMWLMVALALFCAFFFRDPDRMIPLRTGLVVAPADGRVTSVGFLPPPIELGIGTTPRWRVATFLSVLDVHINRLPVDGTVTAVAYHPGSFLNAADDKASDENERNALAVTMADGRTLAVVQIAGLIARRIICDVQPGAIARKGARFGLIRFGSRVDLYLPEGVEPLVIEGQRMVGGETVMADLAAAEPRRVGEER